MEKTKNYKAFFTAPVVKAAVKKFTQLTTKAKVKSELFSLEVGDREASWTFDTLEEFLGAYKQSARQAALHSYVDGDKYRLSLHWDHGSTTRVSVRAPSRVEIETIFNIFEEKFAESQLPAEEESYQPPVVFVGHGGSGLWRDLKDHLQDKHGYDVQAYEIGSRAGHTIRDILEEMLEESSFALLVLTGEDETKDGKLHARQNVVHETGLFQGRLGFSRAIVLLEDGTEEFSNIAGIQQIRFSKGNIKETFGDVLAVLKREFGR